jgi:hypothetical protein
MRNTEKFEGRRCLNSQQKDDKVRVTACVCMYLGRGDSL